MGRAGERTRPAGGNSTSPSPSCMAIHIGIWGESQRASRGRSGLLYQQVLSLAMQHDIQGATVWNSIEGLNPHGRFRSIENEVASNDLPVWMTLMHTAQDATATEFLRAVIPLVDGRGVVVSEPVWWLKDQSHVAQVAEGGHTMHGMQGPSKDPPGDLGGQPGYHVQVFMRENATVDGKPVYQAVAELLRSHGILWMSTMRGLAGYGEGRKVRGRGLFGARADVPVTMHIVDSTAKLQLVLPDLVALVGEHALLITSNVALHSHSGQ